jgi:hypothetical protein
MASAPLEESAVDGRPSGPPPTDDPANAASQRGNPVPSRWYRGIVLSMIGLPLGLVAALAVSTLAATVDSPPLLWIALLALFGSLVARIALPLAVYSDATLLRRFDTDWSPVVAAYTLGTALAPPGLELTVALVYLLRRRHLHASDGT